MRLVPLAILPLAALLTGGATAERKRAPFDGAWMSCETYQGSRICSYTLTAQRGARVCGVQRDFATNAYYTQRFIARAEGNRADIDKICGDPGSETDTYCAGQAPANAEKVGWSTSDQTLHACGNRLYGTEAGTSFRCAAARPAAGLPKVRSLGGEGPEPEDAAWMASCLRGED
ncbi:hypothetical protein [Sphingopyxis sp.]|uniref:hypothetical protein n=1 Tax=Sphingopyxis sp. TaxID=1908224 RepID=UPI0035AEE9E2